MTVHPTIFKLVDKLIEIEQVEVEHTLARIEGGANPPPRRPKYVKSDQRIIDTIKKFNEDIFEGSFQKYLTTLAHNVSF